MRFTALFVLAVLLFFATAKARKHHNNAKKRRNFSRRHKASHDNISVKRNIIRSLSLGDPYGSIGPIIPMYGSQFQSAVEDGSLIRSDQIVRGNSRYDIPDEDLYDDQAYKHSEHFPVETYHHDFHHDIEPYHWHHHIEPYHWNGPIDNFHHYDDHHYDDHHADLHYAADYGLPEYTDHHHHHHHHHDYHHVDPYAHYDYALEGFPGYVGNVLSNSEAQKLGFDDSYLKKLGFDGSKWSHGYGSYYGGGRGGGYGWGAGRWGSGGSGTCSASVDLAFLIDGSTDKVNFAKFIEFAKAVVNRLKVSEKESRVAVVTYSDRATLKFGFDKHLSNRVVVNALDDIKENFQKADGRKLPDGLLLAKSDLFEVSGRDEKNKVLIVLTDHMENNHAEQAQPLKDMAVSVYVVGPRADINEGHAKQLASSKEEWFVHRTENYDKMIKDVAPIVPNVNCTVDVVFMVDCTKDDDDELKKIKNFIKKSISSLSVSMKGDHVGLVTYGGSAEAITKFHLKKKTDSRALMTAIQDFECGKGGSSGGDKALTEAKSVFDKSGREEAIHVAIYLTGKNAGNEVVDPAKALRNFGVRLYAIGFASEATEASLKTIASKPSDFYVHDKDNVDKLLSSVAQTLIDHFDQLKGTDGSGGSGGYGRYGGYSGYGGYGGYSGYSYSGSSRSKSQKSSSSSRANIEPKQDDTQTVDNDDSDEQDATERTIDERQKIQGESLVKPTLDADDNNNDDDESDNHGSRRTIDSGNKDPPRKVSDFGNSKDGDQKQESSESKVENDNEKYSSENGEKTKDEKSSFKDNKNNESSSNTESTKNETLSASDDSNEKKIASSDKNAKSSNVRPSSPDPYVSIGTDMSSEASAMDPKISQSQSSVASSPIKADVSSSPTDIKGDEVAAENIHTDIVESNKALPSASVDNAKKRGLDKKSKSNDDDIMNKPVGSLVKSILDKAARHAVQDFTKSSGLKNVAKLLVKSAVHNALMSRPRFAKAFKSQVKGKKEAKKGKKKSHKKTSSKEDLMDEDNDKRQNTAKEPSITVMEPAARKSTTAQVLSVVDDNDDKEN